MIEIDPKLTFSASAVMSSTIAGHAEHKRETVQLSERASQVASQFSANAISPVVISGVIRLIEFFVIMFIGVGVYFWYVYPFHPINW